MSSPIDKPILETAATWYVDLMDAPEGGALRQAHQIWLNQAPAHQMAWNRVTRLQMQLVEAQHPLSHPTLSAARFSRRQTIKALSLLLFAGTGLATYREGENIQALFSQYRTGTGQTRDITLMDGSRLQLNTATAVDIRYDDSTRIIKLYRGEALVTTAADVRQRPFYLCTPEGSVRALGTRFSVFSDGGRSRVRVFEHAVEVRLAGKDAALTIGTGQVHDFTRTRHRATALLHQHEDAWTQGLLIVSDWRLDRFVQELGRYTPGILSVDEQVAALRISGAFNLTDIPAVLENLSATLPVQTRRRTLYWTRIEAPQK